MRRKKVCFVGYGSTEYSRKSEASALSYYADAIRARAAPDGARQKDIRGFSITTQASPDYSPHVAEQLGLEVDWVLNGDYGGAGGVDERQAGGGRHRMRPPRPGRSWSAAIPSIEARRRSGNWNISAATFVDVLRLRRAEFLNGADSAIAHGQLRHHPGTDRQDRHRAAL